MKATSAVSIPIKLIPSVLSDSLPIAQQAGCGSENSSEKHLEKTVEKSSEELSGKPSERLSETKINLLDLDLKSLAQFFVSIGEKPFRAQQIFKWIHQRGVTDFALMTDLSKALRERLPNLCEIKAPEIVKEQCSVDGTRKWLLRLDSGNHIETVFIPEKGRGTLCVSSQVGCALNCTFCSTATQGFNRNLTVSEIIGQVWQAVMRLRALGKDAERIQSANSESLNIHFENINSANNESVNNPFSNQTEKTQSERPAVTNVVMMGMGEPLLNFEAVNSAMAIMRDELAYALPRRRVTLSTSGIVPNIDRLSKEADVSLAVSLHAPNDLLRNTLVPINKKYPISVLMEACRGFANDKRGRHITMEYVMLRGVNDKTEHARQLVKILQGVPCKVNLIPFNPFPGASYQRSLKEDIHAFRDIVVKSGFITTVRRTRGDDIDAACGQLVGQITDRTKRNARFIAKTTNPSLLSKESQNPILQSEASFSIEEQG